MGQSATRAWPEINAVRDRAETIFNLYGAFRNAKVPIIGIVQGRAVGLRLRACRALRHASRAKKRGSRFPRPPIASCPLLPFQP